MAAPLTDEQKARIHAWTIKIHNRPPSSILTDEQKARIHAWAAEGADLNQIQDRLKTELGITLLFMDVRFLIADLGITLAPRQPEAEEEEKPEPEPEEQEPGEIDETEAEWQSPDGSEPPPAGGVKLTVDQLTLPGAMVSGKVTFSDGVTAQWYLDQMGSLGLAGVDRAYQPPAGDIPLFQRQLQKELRRAGY